MRLEPTVGKVKVGYPFLHKPAVVTADERLG